MAPAKTGNDKSNKNAVIYTAQTMKPKKPIESIA
jgi:hypothetical protein